MTRRRRGGGRCQEGGREERGRRRERRRDLRDAKLLRGETSEGSNESREANVDEGMTVALVRMVHRHLRDIHIGTVHIIIYTSKRE